MAENFQRENRYIVIKISDAKAALSKRSKGELNAINESIDDWRHGQGKHRLAAVVVEHDWPEYDVVWAMLEARAMGKPAPVQEPMGLAQEVIGCFHAAEIEGLTAALANTTDEHLKDLVERRLMYALYAAQEATTPPAAQPAQQDIPDLIAGALGVSRGTAYDLMREALKEAAPVQEPVVWPEHELIQWGAKKYGPLMQAAINLLAEIDSNHDSKSYPQKYGVPYGAVNILRDALTATPPTQPAPVPLTDEQIMDALKLKSCDGYRAIVRAIEDAHGITEKGGSA